MTYILNSEVHTFLQYLFPLSVSRELPREKLCALHQPFLKSIDSAAQVLLCLLKLPGGID